MKKIKLMSVFGTLGAISVPLAMMVSCSSSTNNNEKNAATFWVGNRRHIKEIIATKGAINPMAAKHFRFKPWHYLVKDNLNSVDDARNSARSTGYILKFTGRPQYDVNGELKNGSKESKTWLGFGLYDKVTLKFKPSSNRNDEVYDKDTTNLEDDKSINGKKFNDALKSGDVIKIINHVKPNVYWIKNKTGEKTNHKVIAEDFWYGLQNSISSSSAKIYALGGNEAADKHANKKWGTFFSTPGHSIMPPFMIGYYGVAYNLNITDYIVKYDAKKDEIIDDNTNVVDNVQNTFSYNFTNKASDRNVWSFWKSEVLNNGGHIALPKWQIQDVSDKEQMNMLKTNSPAKKYGAYTYNSLKWYEYTSAGMYYASNVAKQYQVWKKNMYYAQEDFVNSKTNVLSKTVNYISRKGEYITAQWEEFKNGRNRSSNLNKLSNSIQVLVKKNPKKYGLAYSKGRTVGSRISDYSWFNALPVQAHFGENDVEGRRAGSHNTDEYFFNNNFAKVMYGVGLEELVDPQIDTQEKIANSMYAGSGLSFRTGLRAAINWWNAVKSYSLNSQPWANVLAPETKIKWRTNSDGQDAVKEAKFLSSFAINFDGKSNAIDIEITKQDQLDIFEGTQNEKDKFLAPTEKLNQIKEQISKAIDNALSISLVEYNKLNDSEKEKHQLIFELPVGRSLLNPRINPSYENMRLAINSLDPRIKAVAQVKGASFEDKSSSGGSKNKLVDASITKENFEVDWTMDKGGSSRNWLKRLIGFDISAWGISNGIDFTNPSAGGTIVENIGYIQTGYLNGLSFYYDKFLNDPNFTKYMNNSKLLKELPWIAQQFVEQLSKWKDNFKFDASLTSTNDKKEFLKSFGFSSDKAIEIFEAFQNIKFQNIWKSNAKDVAYYDYFAWEGFEGIKQIMIDNDVANKTLAQSARLNDASIASNMINIWFALTGDLIEAKFAKMTEQEVKAKLIAFNKSFGLEANIGNSVIGDRTKPNSHLSKTWYYRPADDYHNPYLHGAIVDV